MQSGRANPKIERPNVLHLEKTFCDENINITFRSGSEDDYSPEMNCKKVIDKPTLVSAYNRYIMFSKPMYIKIISFYKKIQVKRLTMGLLRINDQESRPLGTVAHMIKMGINLYP